MTDYRPVPCAVYSQYELAILHRRCLRLRWCGDDGLTHLEFLSPADLETCGGEEFLLAHSLSGETVRVRLDRVRAIP